MSIEISPKYGLNPTIPVCFWCGEEKNEIALLGRVREKDSNGKTIRGTDIEVGRRVIVDYEPCDKCKELFNQGVHIVECSKYNPNNLGPITKDEYRDEIYPTGRYLILKLEVAKKIFGIDDSCKRLCLDKKLYQDIFKEVL